MTFYACALAFTVGAVCSFASGTESQKLVFLRQGVPESVYEEGDAWTRGKGYLECTGMGNMLYAGREASIEVGRGDFRVVARLRIRKLSHTAATFKLGDSHFGFDGESRRLFLSGPLFGNKVTHLNAATDFIQNDRWFAFEAIRRGSKLSFVINSRVAHQANVGSGPLGAMGFRPWRSTMQISDFWASGSLKSARRKPRPSKIAKIDVSQFVFANGREGYPVYRIPSVVTGHEGTVLAIAEGRSGRHDVGANDLVLKRSADKGQTWSKLQVIQDDGKNSLNGPCAVLTDTGRVLLIYHHYTAGTHERNAQPGHAGNRAVRNFITYSDDDGRSWSSPRDITRQTKKPTGWTSILTGPGVAIQLRREPYAGRIVVPCAHGPVGKYRSYVCFSDDNGDSWQLGGEVPDAGNECQVVELADGRLMLNMRSYRGKGCRALSFSDDGGTTWSPAVDASELIEPVCQGCTLRYSDPLDGQPSRILFSNPASKTKRICGTIRLSRNDGRTWPVSKVLYHGGFGYSCLTVLGDGRIGCLYERDGRGIAFDVFGLDALTEPPPGINGKLAPVE